MLINACVCGRTNGLQERHGQVLVRRCACGVARLESTLTVEEYERQYADGSYHESTVRHDHCVPYAERYENDYRVAGVRAARYRQLLNGRFAEQTRVLDVGCANGAFVSYLGSMGLDACGLDPHPVVENPLLKRGTLAQPPIDFITRRFDLVCYHDVLEHIIDPLAELQRARYFMSMNGTIVIDVPDVRSPAGQHHWKPEHLWYWTPQTLMDLLARASFHPITMDTPIPGKLVVYGSAV